MESFWKGMISPGGLIKHRLGTGDITNHITIEEIVYDVEEGVAHIIFGFVAGPGGYELDVDWSPDDGEIDESTAIDMVVDEIDPDPEA